MEIKKLTLSILPEKLGICHFAKNTPIPDWANPVRNFLKQSTSVKTEVDKISNGAKEISFCSITRTSDELSIVYPQDKIPGGVLFEKDWRAFKLEGLVDMYFVGIIASLSKLLADNGISIFNISTYKTNYLLVEEKNLAQAKKILSQFYHIKK